MNPSRLFILKPIATTLLAFALLLSGILSYRFLPVSALPEIDYPIIQVQTFYPGASPKVVANTITAPLEGQFGQMSGLTQMSSASSNGSSIITLQFSLETPLDVAVQEVQAAINAAGNLLPTDLPTPPVYNKVNPADPPVLTLSVTSKTVPTAQIADYVNTLLVQKISQVKGVGLVTQSGGQRPAVRIRINPTALASYGLSLDDARTAIASANTNLAKGSFDGPLRSSTIDVNDQMLEAAEYLSMVLGYRNGAPVYLRDVADAIQGPEDIRLRAWVGTTQAILVNIQRQPGANVLEVAENVKKLLPQLQYSLPEALDVRILTDRTVTIQASVNDVKFELILSVILVAGVTLLFLHNLPATFIPTVAIPLSLVGTFGTMYLAGFSLNNLTLMALAIATGFVVDDAIVVIENISRHLEMEPTPKEAALKGARQIGFTIISLTFSLVAVLIPLLFMRDVVGRLFREFAVTLSIAILLSAVISLTLTPMMCAYILHREDASKTGKIEKWLIGFFDTLIAGYDRGLQWVFKHQRFTLITTLITLVFSVSLYIFIPKGFIPVQDTGILQGFSEAPQSVSFEAMSARQQALAAALMQDPDVENISAFIGLDGINTTLNNGRILINLVPIDKRKDRASAIIPRLQQRAADVAGITLYLQAVQDLTVEDRISRSQYQFILDSVRQEDLDAWVPRFITSLKENTAITDVASDMQNQGLQAYIHIDRDTASRLGVSMTAVDNALYNAFGQRQISTIFTQSNQYHVVLEVLDEFRTGLQSIQDIYVPGANNTPIPLHSFARIEERPTPLSINRQGQFPAAAISFNLKPGASLERAVSAINDTAQKIGLPPSVQITSQGAIQAFQSSLSNVGWLLLAAIFTVYIVLGVLYESYIHPLTILSALPSAGVGALLALILCGLSLDIVSIIGLILLIGIVKKNAIMMIDFALDAQRNENKSPQEAIHQACLLRFRPIIMTTMAALFGAFPLMLSSGMGSELRNPLGITMVGGLLLSQLLTLFTTPVIYLYFERLRVAVQKRFQPQMKEAPPAIEK